VAPIAAFLLSYCHKNNINVYLTVTLLRRHVTFGDVSLGLVISLGKIVGSVSGLSIDAARVNELKMNV